MSFLVEQLHEEQLSGFTWDDLIKHTILDFLLAHVTGHSVNSVIKSGGQILRYLYVRLLQLFGLEAPTCNAKGAKAKSVTVLAD